MFQASCRGVQMVLALKGSSLSLSRWDPLSRFRVRRHSELSVADERRRSLPGVVLLSPAQPQALLLRLLPTENADARPQPGEQSARSVCGGVKHDDTGSNTQREKKTNGVFARCGIKYSPPPLLFSCQ